MKKAIKIVLGIILVLVVLSVLFIGYLFWQDTKERKQSDRVEMSVKYNLESCPTEFPLSVLIKNNSSRTVDSIDFDIKVRRKRYSNDLADWIDYESDKIIEPGDIFASCWKYKLRPEYEMYNNPDDLDFEVEYKYVRFQE